MYKNAKPSIFIAKLQQLVAFVLIPMQSSTLLYEASRIKAKPYKRPPLSTH